MQGGVGGPLPPCDLRPRGWDGGGKVKGRTGVQFYSGKVWFLGAKEADRGLRRCPGRKVKTVTLKCPLYFCVHL